MTALNKQALRDRYSPQPVPKCHICGSVMTIARASAGAVVYACSGCTYDDNGAHYAPGRSLGDDHYSASRVTIFESGDPEVLALLDELEAAEKRIAKQSEIVAAAEKLVRCKGRYHSELNYRALAKLFGVTTPDLPPLKHENVHYADAAEMEIAALRQRIAELEARTVKLPTGTEVNGFQMLIEEEVIARLRESGVNPIVVRAAGIGVKGE